VILGATTPALAAAVRELFRTKHVHKVYQALVFGRPLAPEAVWKDRLQVQKRGAQIRTHGRPVQVPGRAPVGIPAETHLRVLRLHRAPVGPGLPPVALLELTPKTGRSHQLRVQCAQRDLPIVGDATYGDFGANRAYARLDGPARLCLHSHHTRFSYNWQGRAREFTATAPTPPELLAAW
jgi:tRNA pseudouridine65 synthase